MSYEGLEVFFTIILLVLVIGFLAIDFSRSRECTKLFSEWVDFGKIRVMYTNLQILRSIPSALSVTFPNPVRAFFAALDLTHLNPFTLIAGECVNSSIAKYDTLVIVSTLLFAAVCVLNWLVFAIRVSVWPAQRLKGFTQHMTLFLSLTVSQGASEGGVASERG